MTLEQLVPRAGSIELEALLETYARTPRGGGEPFHPLRVDFADALSRALFRHSEARAYPDVLAAAFWTRRSSVMRLGARFAALQTTGSLRTPRGLAFHLPPTNVDTLFIYPLMVSMLVGNMNIVRVSRRRPSPQVAILTEVLREVLAEERFAALRDELVVVGYGHEPEPTAAISRVTDVRLLWGGDETVERLRAVPITPAAHELAFGDRFSFAVLRATAVLDADESSRRELARQLFNDAYWFDQLACASPRALIWVGAPSEVDAASEILFAELAQVIAAHGYRLGPGMAMAKMTFTYRALIDRPIESVRQVSNELVVLRLASLEGFDRTHPGAGLFFEARVEELSELIRFVERRDQTLAAHGFEASELTAFARSLRGRGIDRIVPFGEALTFDSLWDGYDLLAELSRSISVPAAG